MTAVAREPLALWDIRDAEAFAAAIAREHSGHNALSHHDEEDLRAYLLATCWELSVSYKPGSVSFSSWAGTTPRRRVVDHKRQRDGRTTWKFGNGRVYERPRPQFVSLDDAGLDEAVAAEPRDSPTDWLADDGGLLADRDRTRAADLVALGLEVS
jgi:DNA-directed RNA polymerase specialized sigma24 family protein